MEKQRYFIHLAYNGTEFHGWQIQPNAPTVQEALMDVLGKLLREKVEVIGCGRTDTGVHASDFYAHFDTAVELDLEKIKFKCNCMLPWGIVVHEIFKVNEQWHTRFSATGRTYHYHIHQAKNPFNKDLSYYLRESLDENKMNEAAKLLFNYIDFTSFSKAHTDTKTNNCKIELAYWERNGDQLKFTIKADRFLRNMVRAIVGTLLDIGKGKLQVEDLDKIIQSKDRGKAGYSVPACGLYLAKVDYPEEVFSQRGERWQKV